MVIHVRQSLGRVSRVLCAPAVAATRPLQQPARMATRLFFALALLLASVQLSHAVHFTNQNWTVVQWKDFLLQWEYDDGDPPNNGWYWGVVVWSAPNKGPVQLSNDIFNSMF